MMEFRRVLVRYSFWMVVVLALGLNVFLFLRTQGQQYSTWASVYEVSEKELQQVYVKQIRELQTMPISDAVTLGSISIFADKDAFSSGNLKMTARDFTQLDGKVTI